jgi:hypothetical protein
MTQYTTLAILCLMSTALSSALGAEMGMDVELVPVKKEKKDPSQRATVLTAHGIQQKLKSINRVDGEVNCLDCSVKFIKWAIGQNKNPEQAENYVPMTPNFEFLEPKEDSSEDEHVVELQGFLRKSDALEEVLRQYPEIMDVDSNQSYIDVELDFKALFRRNYSTPFASV